LPPDPNFVVINGTIIIDIRTSDWYYKTMEQDVINVIEPIQGIQRKLWALGKPQRKQQFCVKAVPVGSNMWTHVKRY